MDEELRKAAVRGDVEFLKQCIESNKPFNFYNTFFPREDDQSNKRLYGNIFHMAAIENKEEFIREVMTMGVLTQEVKQQLLLQPGDEEYKWNPLHEAAKVGNVEIVKMFLDVYRCLPTLPSHLSERPWLLENSRGDNPCFVAIYNKHKECAHEIYKTDPELISNMPSFRGCSLVFEAVHAKMSKLALEILRSPHFVNCGSEPDNFTPFHSIHYIEGSEGSEEIFREVLRRDQELIRQRDTNGDLAFHVWAYNGKIWPFKTFLKCDDIIQHVNKVFIDLVPSKDADGDNLLHNLADCAPCKDEDAKKIAELVIEVYKKNSSSLLDDQLPWLVKNKDGETPLSLAIAYKKEDFAKYILSVNENAVIENEKNVLFLAIENECQIVAEEILKLVNNKGWTQLLTNDQKLNVLHLAPLCTENFCAQLVKGYPELIKRVDKEGSTIIHSWIKSDKEYLFKFMLESKWKVSFVELIDVMDYNDQNNPFHIAATTTHEATIQIVRLLVEAYKEHCLNLELYEIGDFPWFEKNKENEGPLHLAIRNQREELALYLLSLLEDDDISELLDYYEPEHSILFLAIQNNCPQVAETIMSRLDKENWTKYLKDPSDGKNILHLATSLTDVKFGTFLVNEAPEFITEQDDEKQSPWDTAYDIGPAWFIKAVLKKDKSVFNTAPLAWIKACEKGHVSALHAFISHNPGAFRDLCIIHEDSPLHHLKLSSLTEYEEFLRIRHMKDLINLQNSAGETPLHKAIRKKDIFLAETLLNKKKILYNINDSKNVTAMDLLAHACKNNAKEWGLMCKRNGLDPQIKTTYLQHKTNLLDVRTSLFVVAALLATITFTAGFTLPGGFNQDTGEALLGKKASFLVFLVSDTLALFFSMLVLICLTWSMVFETSKSLLLVDRSMVLLRISLNCTLLAFMTGVYIVMAPKSLWVAIVIIVVISLLIIISIDKNFLYDIMNKFPAAKRECKDPLHLVELGYKTQDEMDSLLSHHSKHNSNQSNKSSSRSSRKTSSQSSDDEGSNDESSDDEVSADEGSNDEVSKLSNHDNEQDRLLSPGKSSNQDCKSVNSLPNEDLKEKK